MLLDCLPELLRTDVLVQHTCNNNNNRRLVTLAEHTSDHADKHTCTVMNTACVQYSTDLQAVPCVVLCSHLLSMCTGASAVSLRACSHVRLWPHWHPPLATCVLLPAVLATFPPRLQPLMDCPPSILVGKFILLSLLIIILLEVGSLPVSVSWP